MTTQHVRKVAVRRWDDLVNRERLIPVIDVIFYDSSNTKTFASAAEREAFRERWLGRYLERAPQWAYLAIASDGSVAGYLVGSVANETEDAATANIPEFATLVSDYPAHLHVNLAAPFRNRGIGRDLIDAFAADAAGAGARGVHIVTSADARNVRFYERAGFRGIARTSIGGREQLFMGRRLGASETS